MDPIPQERCEHWLKPLLHSINAIVGGWHHADLSDFIRQRNGVLLCMMRLKTSLQHGIARQRAMLTDLLHKPLRIVAEACGKV